MLIPGGVSKQKHLTGMCQEHFLSRHSGAETVSKSQMEVRLRTACATKID